VKYGRHLPTEPSPRRHREWLSGGSNQQLRSSKTGRALSATHLARFAAYYFRSSARTVPFGGIHGRPVGRRDAPAEASAERILAR
jgi:hypothetical protein